MIIEKGNRRVFQKSKRFYFFENPGSEGKLSLRTREKVWVRRIPPSIFWVEGNRTGRSKTSFCLVKQKRSVRRWMRGVRAFRADAGKEFVSVDEQTTRDSLRNCR